VIDHRRLLLLGHAIAGVEPREQRLAVGQPAAGGARELHRPRQIEQVARGLGALLAGVLALEPVEIERRQEPAEQRVRRDGPERVLEDGDRHGDVPVRPRAGGPVVAALAEAAEREPRAGEVGRAVAVQDARPGARVDPLEPRRRAGEHGVREPVRAGLEDRDRFFVGVDHLDAQIGAEHLDVGVAGDVVDAVGQPVHRRRAVRAAGQPAAGHHGLGAGPARGLERGLDLGERGGAGDRAGEHRRILGAAERQLARAAGERVDEPVRDRAVDEHAIGAGAALARRQVAADHDLVHGLAERGVVEHDAGVLAAHLERDQELGPVDGGLEDPPADPPAAGEAQPAQRELVDERGADVAGADDHVQHAGRQARGERGLGVALAAQRRDVAGLHDHGVAGEQRRDDVGVAEVDREVERPDHADDPERLEPQVLAGRDLPRLQIAGHRGLHELEPVQDRLDLGASLAADLAGLQHDRVRERLGARGQLLREAHQVGEALRGRQRGPPGQRGGGGGRGLGRSGHGVPGLEHHGAIGGRVSRDQGLATRCDERSPNKVAERLHRRSTPARSRRVKS
jgi:hypothetical protein